MKTNHNKNKTIIAVPYYGTLSRPPSGLSRIFFLAEVDLEQKVTNSITLQVWNPKKEPNLFFWLRQMETDGLICSDSPTNYGAALNAEGIWVQWGQQGEVYEVIEKWIQSKQERSKSFAFKTPASSRAPLTLEPKWETG